MQLRLDDELNSYAAFKIALPVVALAGLAEGLDLRR
jgi:hypothetical protein